MKEVCVILICVLSLALFYTGIMMVRLRRQIREICRQLAFHKRESSNQEIRIEVHTKEILMLQDEINELFTESRRLEIEYKKADETLKNMITNISHDIRTPLTSVDGYFQLLCETESEAEKQKYAEIIRSRLTSLSTLLEQLFTYVRVQNHGLQMELVSCDMKQLLCENLFSFYEDFKQRGMEPVVYLTEEEVFVKLDANSFSRVLQNVLKNTLVHGSETIMISLEKKGQSVKLNIKNNTYEEHSDSPDMVFERFFQGDKARNHHSSGLGLCIAKELVEQMNGTIHAYYQDSFFGIEMEFTEAESTNDKNTDYRG